MLLVVVAVRGHDARNEGELSDWESKLVLPVLYLLLLWVVVKAVEEDIWILDSARKKGVGQKMS